MKRPVLQRSKAGSIAAGLFLLAFFGLFAWLFFSAPKNLADSGESGPLLLLSLGAFPLDRWRGAATA